MVNGGGLLTVNYEEVGFLRAQRQIQVPWQDVHAASRRRIDSAGRSKSRPIDLSAAAPVQVARGSLVSDSSGTRQRVAAVSPGDNSVMEMADGSMQPVDSLSVRATEYTVGANGPKSMPAELPPSSGYTYAVELTADEAIAAAARSRRFSQPLSTTSRTSSIFRLADVCRWLLRSRTG